MFNQAYRIPISISAAEGAYSVRLLLGASQQPAVLLLDTGSSALAVRQSCYTPADDSVVTLSSDFQLVQYGAGGWAGSMVSTQVTLAASAEGPQSLSAQAELAVIVDEPSHNFYQADGIWGLAYAPLDHAVQAADWLAAQQVEPPLSWPWPATVLDSSAPIATLRQQLQSCPKRAVQPLWDALQSHNPALHANQFALLTHRAFFHHSSSNQSADYQSADYQSADHLSADQQSQAGTAAAAPWVDPLNLGLLVLGDAKSCHELYQGDWQRIALCHDKYYNTNLLSLQLGDAAPFAVPPLDAKDVAAYASNSIIDSGSSLLFLEQSCWQYLRSTLEALNPALLALFDAGASACAQLQGIDMQQLQLADWPALQLTFTGVATGRVATGSVATGGVATEQADSAQGEATPVTLTVLPQHYWQLNAPSEGQAMLMLAGQLSGWAKQSILGLPLLNGHYVVFDRSAAQGLGEVAFARAANSPEVCDVPQAADAPEAGCSNRP